MNLDRRCGWSISGFLFTRELNKGESGIECDFIREAWEACEFVGELREAKVGVTGPCDCLGGLGVAATDPRGYDSFCSPSELEDSELLDEEDSCRGSTLVSYAGVRSISFECGGDGRDLSWTTCDDPAEIASSGLSPLIIL